MLERNETIVSGEVLQEFLFEGRPAFIVLLNAKDAANFESDIQEHGTNLAKNQETPRGEENTKPIQGIFNGLVQRMRNLGPIKNIVDRKRDDLTKRISTTGERKKQNLQDMISNGVDNKGFKTEMIGIFVDGRIVSIIGVKEMEKLPSNGRQVFEYTNGSTLQAEDEAGKQKYADKGFSKMLRKALFERKLKENPDAVWMSDSKNPRVLESWRRWGWDVIDIDDPNSEVATVFRERNAEYWEDVYKKGGYKLAFCDPKVNQLNW